MMQSAVRPEPVWRQDDELHWLALRMVPGLGTRTAVWTPAAWNLKFLAVGNGGSAGSISYAAMVAP